MKTSKMVWPDIRTPWVALRVAVFFNLLLILVSTIRVEAESPHAVWAAFFNGAPLAEGSFLLGMAIVMFFWTKIPNDWRGATIPIVGGVSCVTTWHWLRWLGGDVSEGWLFPAICGFMSGQACSWYLELRFLRLSPALVEARLAALQARIRPHFFFNCLGAIIGFVAKDPKLAEEALLDLSDLFRAAMKKGEDFSTVLEELSLTKKYVGLEKMRFGDRLVFSESIDPAAGNAIMPRLLLQPLVENAIVHGVEPLGSGLVSLRGFVSESRVFLVVENQYFATAEKSRVSNQIAQDNIRDRLEILYDKDAKIESYGKNGIWRTVVSFPVAPNFFD